MGGRRNKRAQTISMGAVSHLVVILDADDESRAIDRAHAAAVAAAVKHAITTVVHKHVVIGFGQVLGAAKILVIAVALAGQQRVNAVVEVVVPDAVQSVAALLARADQPDVVLVGLGRDVDQPLGPGGFALHGRRDLGQDMARAEVINGLDRVEPQAVDVKIPHPHPRVVDDELPHGVTLLPVVIDGPAPGRPIAVGEIGPEVARVIPLGAQVVVNHVQDHGQSAAMGGVDQALQRPGPAIAVLHGIRKDGVVTPVALRPETGPRASTRSP